jgi:hypothetical protein
VPTDEFGSPLADRDILVWAGLGAGHVLTRSPGRRPTGEFYKDIAHA